MSPAGSCARAALDRRVVRCSCAAREANCGGNDREIVVLGRIHLLAVSGFESGDSGGWLHHLPKAHVVLMWCLRRDEESRVQARGAGESSTFEPASGWRWTSDATSFLCLLPVRRCLLDHDTQRDTCRASGCE